jgi:hypothetical protein
VIGASNNLIGSSGSNQIVGNIQTGVYIVDHDISGTVFSATANNEIQNNSIRTNGIFGVLLFNTPNNAVDTTGATRNVFSGNPVNIRNALNAVNAKAPQPVPRSILLDPPSAGKGHRAHDSKPVRTRPQAHATRPRVPALIPQGSPLKLVSHKASGLHVRVR